MAQALVPLKDLVQAKSRLSGLLRPSERRALAQAMVEDVLAVLSSHPEIDRVTLVSDDPGADLLANKYAIEYLPESTLDCRGLNAVVQLVSTRLLVDSEDTLVVLHGDLPLLTTADISDALHCQRQLDGLVVGCDQQGVGTNLLAFTRHSMPQFHFGVDSCARHLASARGAGVPVQVLQRLGIGLDVDEPRDLQAVMVALDADGAGNTSDLLCGSGLGTRIALALATLADSRGVDKEITN
jgi:2-phospho-L-lactate guanylyltransferase